jgi:hypothetical protein
MDNHVYIWIYINKSIIFDILHLTASSSRRLIMKGSILLLLLLVNNLVLGDRTFRIVNQCNQIIWMKIDADNKDAIPMNGGFDVAVGQTKEMSLPDEWISGRFWPRTGCKDENGKLICATGT